VKEKFKDRIKEIDQNVKQLEQEHCFNIISLVQGHNIPFSPFFMINAIIKTGIEKL
jgi:hypothetical protein